MRLSLGKAYSISDGKINILGYSEFFAWLFDEKKS